MPTPELKIAAAYIRVSTEDQTEYSPDAQLVEIRKFAKREGFIIPEAHIYIDEGITGRKTAKRDAFNQMIGTAKTKPKPFDAILLWKFSRFARNREDSVVYKSMLRRQLGIDVLSVSEPVGDDKMSVLIEALIEAMDEYYSINLAEEVKRGMTEAARRGKLQATASFGYKLADGALVPDPDEAALVKEIFRRFIGGDGLYPIARQLNSLGALTHRGNQFENRTVEYILRNPVYIGKLRWNPAGRTRRDYKNENIILADADHEPLIDQETWDKAQHILDETKARLGHHRRPATELKTWPGGIVRCASCGATLIFSKPNFMKCNNYAKGRCLTSQHIRADLIEEAIIERLERDRQSLVPPPYKITRLSGDYDERSSLQRALETVDRKMLRLHEAFMAGADTVEEYKNYKEQLQTEATEITEKLAALDTAANDEDNADKLKTAIGAALSVLRSSSTSKLEKHNAADKIIESCMWDKSEYLLTITYRVCI